MTIKYVCPKCGFTFELNCDNDAKLSNKLLAEWKKAHKCKRKKESTHA